MEHQVAETGQRPNGVTRRVFVKRAAALGLSLPAIATILAACQDEASRSGESNGAAASGELITAVEELATSLDSQRAYGRQGAIVSRNMFETGMYWDVIPGTEDETTFVPDYSAIKPHLYESWEISPDGLTLTVKVKPGIMSENGNELTADSVKMSYDRSASSAGVFGAFFLDYLGVETARLGEDDGEAVGVEIVDTYTAAITTKEPHTHLVTVQTVPVAFPPYDAEEVKKRSTDDDPWAAKWADTHNLGYSAWRVESYEPGTSAVFAPNEGFVRQTETSRFIQQVATQSSSRFSSLQSGSVQIGEFLGFRELQQLQDAEGVTVHRAGGSLFVQPILNTKQKPFTDPKVRQALNYAVPRDEINEAVFLGFGRNATAPVTDSYPGYVELGPWPYDLDQARSLLEEAGYADGFETTLTFQAEKPHQREIGQFLLTEFEKIGVELNLKELPGSTFNEAYAAKSEPIIFSEEQAIIADGVYMLFLYFRGGSVPNYSLYENAEVDELIARGLGAQDEEEKIQLAQEAQRIIWDDAPWIWGWYEGFQLATSSNVTGVTWGPQNDYDWAALRLE